MSENNMAKTVIFTQLCEAIEEDGLASIENKTCGKHLAHLIKEIIEYKGYHEFDGTKEQISEVRLWKNSTEYANCEVLSIQKQNDGKFVLHVGEGTDNWFKGPVKIVEQC